jgi:uncharacterized repeat protein (TIGR04076 family)
MRIEEQTDYDDFVKWKEDKRRREEAIENCRLRLGQIIYSNKVVVKVKEIRGVCEAHSTHIGKDIFETCGSRTDGFICPTAFDNIYHVIFAMKYGATLPHTVNPDIVEVMCNDPTGMCVFELRREKTAWKNNPEDFHILDNR